MCHASVRCENYKPKMMMALLEHMEYGRPGFLLVSIGARMTFKYTKLHGFYRAPDRYFAGDTLGAILAEIRDAGGECLAGEPLPPKPELTFPILLRPEKVIATSAFQPPWTHSCSQCGNHFTNGDPRRCSACKASLKGVIPWKPYPANEEC